MIILIVAFDQITKYLALVHLKGKEPFTFIPGIVQFRYTENTGMAFSMFSGARWVFIVLTCVVCAGIMVYLFSNKCSNLWIYWSAAVVAAGGIGNLIDRIRLAYVIDFIEPTFINFAVFNIADSAVTLGAGVLIVYLLIDAFGEKEKKDA